MCIVVARFPGCEVMYFEINLFYQAIFPRDQKSQDKNSNIFRTKKAFRMKQKAFFIIFKEV